jgi:hypothetical protein
MSRQMEHPVRFLVEITVNHPLHFLPLWCPLKGQGLKSRQEVYTLKVKSGAFGVLHLPEVMEVEDVQFLSVAVGVTTTRPKFEHQMERHSSFYE